jgi:aspartate carbamoyltransferase catalytic subunit
MLRVCLRQVKQELRDRAVLAFAAPLGHASAAVTWNRKHLLDIQSLSPEEIIFVLDTARAFKAVGERAIKKVPSLRGKTVVNLFVEPSTRTRISFELAAQRLTADVINFSADTSSLKKGETLKDTARNLEALNADVIIIRHSATGAPHFLSRVINASVVNAGDGAHEHPTQALLDLYTIREKKGRIDGLNVTILGDILYSRVARSNIWGLTKLGAKVTLCGPSTLVPKVFEQMGCRVTYNVQEAIAEADIIHLLRIQHERQRASMFPGLGEYTSLFSLNKSRLAMTKPDALIMHPGPINRGVEIDSEIADCGRSVILEQVTNGLAVRMAVLFLVTGGGSAPSPGDLAG